MRCPHGVFKRIIWKPVPHFHLYQPKFIKGSVLCKYITYSDQVQLILYPLLYILSTRVTAKISIEQPFFLNFGTFATKAN